MISGMAAWSSKWIRTFVFLTFWRWCWGLDLSLWPCGGVLWIVQWEVLWQLHPRALHQHWANHDCQDAHQLAYHLYWVQGSLGRQQLNCSGNQLYLDRRQLYCGQWQLGHWLPSNRLVTVLVHCVHISNNGFLITLVGTKLSIRRLFVRFLSHLYPAVCNWWIPKKWRLQGPESICLWGEEECRIHTTIRRYAHSFHFFVGFLEWCVIQKPT